jgi:hypothetical protein
MRAHFILTVGSFDDPLLVLVDHPQWQSAVLKGSEELVLVLFDFPWVWVVAVPNLVASWQAPPPVEHCQEGLHFRWEVRGP